MSKKVLHLNRNSWLMLWALILCAIALSITLFTSDAPRPIQETDEKVALELQRIDQLKKELQTKVDNFEKENIVGKQQRSFIQRVELTDELRQAAAHEFCGAPNSNYDQATQTVRYTDPETGLSFEVPYNKAWGYEYCYLTPVERHDRSSYGKDLLGFFVFGYPVGADRAFELQVGKLLSEAELQANIEGWDSDMSSVGTTTKRVMNGLTLYDYQIVASPYPVHMWDMLGPNYTFSIKVPVKGEESIKAMDAEVIKILKSLRVTK